MEWSKVKNIIILLLLLVNGFLLVLVAGHRSHVSKYEQAGLTQAIQGLERNGIRTQASALAGLEGMSQFSAPRDLEGEEHAARVLLGEEIQTEDRGGGLYLYRGPGGEISFRPGGEVSAALADDPRWETDDPARHGAELLADMGASVELMDRRTEDGAELLVYCQQWEGAPLFTCQVILTYREGRLAELQGSLLLSGQRAAREVRCLTLPTALFRFLDYILESGDVCSDITAMEAGYQATVTLDGAVQLTPAWRVTSNTALYYLDGVSGQVSRISSD